MVLRNQVEWALHCAVVLAGLPPGRTLSAKVLSEFYGVPKEYLSKALQALASAGLISGATGPSGGYALSKAPAEVSFLDVVEAIEGKDGHFVCREIRRNNPSLPKEASFRSVCGIARVMYDADDAWRKVLGSTTLADILKALPGQVPKDVARRTAVWLSGRAGTRTSGETR